MNIATDMTLLYQNPAKHEVNKKVDYTLSYYIIIPEDNMQFKVVIRGGHSPDQLQEWSQETGSNLKMSMVPWEEEEMALAIFFDSRDKIMGMATLALLQRRIMETQPGKETRLLINDLSPDEFRLQRMKARLKK